VHGPSDARADSENEARYMPLAVPAGSPGASLGGGRGRGAACLSLPKRPPSGGVLKRSSGLSPSVELKPLQNRPTERRRNRTLQARGCPALPVLKTGVLRPRIAALHEVSVAVRAHAMVLPLIEHSLRPGSTRRARGRVYRLDEHCSAVLRRSAATRRRIATRTAGASGSCSARARCGSSGPRRGSPYRSPSAGR
jgi:hypothetical protein